MPVNWSRSIINRHILNELLISTILVVFLLTLLLVFANLLRYEESFLHILDSSDYTFFKFIILLTPYGLTISIPFGFAIALSFLIGRWSAYKELCALNSLGVDSYKLSRPIFLFAILLSCIATFCSLHWAPTNRLAFDSLCEKLAWENFENVFDRKGMITFDLDEQENNATVSQMISLSEFRGSQVKKVSLGVSKITEDYWKSLHVFLYGADDKRLLILSAKEAKAEKNFQDGILRLFPRHIEVETFKRGHDYNASAESSIINFEKLEQPLEFQISKGKEKNLKRMGFFEVFDKAKNSTDAKERKQARDIIGKNSALGLSPFFIMFLILPFSGKIGAYDSFHSLTFGIVICISYFILGTIFFNILKFSYLSPISWWIINILSLIISLIYYTKRMTKRF